MKTTQVSESAAPAVTERVTKTTTANRLTPARGKERVTKMSTRATIARKTADGFEGVYHHWDGYPAGLGETLFRVRNTVFDKNTDRNKTKRKN